MAFLKKKSALPSPPRKRRRRDGEESGATRFLEGSNLVRAAIYTGFCLLAVVICFVGLEERLPLVVTGQRAQQRIVAEFPFSYNSDLATREKVAEAASRALAVYRLTTQPFTEFSDYLRDLLQSLQVLELQLEGRSETERREAIAAFALSTHLPEPLGYRVEPADLETLLTRLDAETRQARVEEGLAILRSLYEKGVHDQSDSGLTLGGDRVVSFSILNLEGKPSDISVQPLAEAQFELNQRLRALAEARVARSLFQIFRTGLKPNLVFDREATNAAKRTAELSVQPVVVRVNEGDTLLEPGIIVTALDQEKLAAYRTELRRLRGGIRFDARLLQNIILTLAFTVIAGLYSRLHRFNLGRQNRRLGLTLTNVLLNLGLLRILTELFQSDLFAGNPDLVVTLIWTTPFFLAPLLTTLLIGPGFAFLSALLVALFSSLMTGHFSDIIFVCLFSSLIALFFAREVRRRGTVVKAGFLGGCSVAICSTLLGFLNEVNLVIILQQATLAMLSGLITGILVVGFLPVLENLFNLTTEITLLELTDYNHPLLRRMQVEAPGSYHHSLMVANLAENAAAAIGANPLVCRTCSLFHDIGKLIKPEYFSENQRGGINPHLAQNPSMSALVIKAHVKEGITLARQYRLPRIVMEVIRQHHGTGLIQYFYYEALKKSRGGSSSPFPDAPTVKGETVDESTYRYDGPKPRFKESAIIFFADSVEAASRSLKKVSHSAIDELLDRLFRDRLEDGQLDECPITFAEIAQIKKSFSFTLLNMLHSRVEYPKRAPQSSGSSSPGKGKTRTPFTSALNQDGPEMDSPPDNINDAVASESIPPASPARAARS